MKIAYSKKCQRSATKPSIFELTPAKPKKKSKNYFSKIFQGPLKLRGKPLNYNENFLQHEQIHSHNLANKTFEEKIPRKMNC